MMIGYIQKENQKGITLIEVLICVIIVAMIIGPLTLNFTTANNTKSEAQNITDATNYAESLMKAVKNRLTEDMIIKEKKEGNTGPLPTAPINEESRYTNYIKKYISEYDKLTSPMDMSLQDYLNVTDMSGYGGNEFAYQVVLWPLSRAATSTAGKYVLKADESSIGMKAGDTMDNKAVLRLTSDAAAYPFDASFFSLLKEDPLTFNATIDSSLTNAFSGTEASSVLSNKFTMPAGAADNAYVAVDLSNAALNTDKNYIVKSSSGSSGTTYGIVIPVKDTNVHTLNLDITALLRTVKLNDQYTFKIVNSTGHDLIVKVMRSYEKKTDSTAQKNEIIDVNNKFHWIAINSSGKTNFEFVDNVVPEENYIIAVFVREKNPPIGKSGKIIKKMVDVFSYDVTYNERR